MKKYLLIIFVFYSSVHFSFAQFNLGPKVGINSAVEDFTEFGNLTKLESSGSHIGIFGRAKFLFLYVQPEFLYSTNQFKIESINDDGSIDLLEYRNNRVDLPLVGGLILFKTLRLGAGPVFSVVTNDSVVGKTSNSIGSKNSTAGFQYNVGLDIWKLVIDFKYETGAGDISDAIFGIEGDYRPNQLMFSIGIKLF